MQTAVRGKIVMRIPRKKFILIGLLIFIGVIILLSVIYHQTALWEPEQSFITLLPESPIGYVTLKELEDFIQTFTRSELGKQAAQMPILAHIKEQLWWKQIVYQKLLWEYEMGGKLDMKAVKGHFGEEAIFALYQREGELAFLLISAVGGTEKLGIEAITATDAINPRYKRIQTEYSGFTINTITGYPLDFSYTFIGKVGVLSLNPLLVAEVLDIYAGKKQGFLAQHPIREKIQDSYARNKSTGYLDVARLATVLGGPKSRYRPLVELIHPLFRGAELWTFGNRYEAGTIISQHRFGNPENTVSTTTEAQHIPPAFLPEQTAFVTVNPDHDWGALYQWLKSNLAIGIQPEGIALSQHLHREMIAALVTHGEGQSAGIPSLILHAPIQAKDALAADLEKLRDIKISVAGKPLEFLELQEYNGIKVQAVRLRLNFLLAFVGGYAIVNDHFFFSTTLAGLKAVLDTSLGDAPTLTDVTFSGDSVQTFIQPNLLVPELKRFLPIAALLASLSGQEVDATLTQHVTNNLFPLESLGPITADVHVEEAGVDAEVRIVLEK